ESMAMGKELLTNALASVGYTWRQLSRKNVDAVLKVLHYKTIDDLCEAVGLGQQVPLVVAHRLVGSLESNVPAQATSTKKITPLLFIKGTEGLVVNFASCCRPIPGDPIVG